MSSCFIDTPFDKFLIFDIDNRVIKRISFSDYKDGTAICGHLKYVSNEVFEKRDLSFFDYSMIGFDFNAKAYRLYRFLMNIKTGKTYTYSEAAEIVFGYKRYARAVASMLHANPFVFFVPCHRIVAKNGIGGYGAGAKLKLKILRWEGAYDFDMEVV